uniref:Uncharacterized protein n=1 Tax=Anguilla anguilla TaxID=7936 RepID=A0A0E9QHU1_ANGAN
MINLLNTAPH